VKTQRKLAPQVAMQRLEHRSPGSQRQRHDRILITGRERAYRGEHAGRARVAPWFADHCIPAGTSGVLVFWPLMLAPLFQALILTPAAAPSAGAPAIAHAAGTIPILAAVALSRTPWRCLRAPNCIGAAYPVFGRA
jgi:hypothetical protein